MSYCQKQGPGGKDTVIFATKEDHSVPSTVDLPVPEPQAGLLLPSGDINWNCPCLGGMATGPCGVPFRNAFSCFHYSTADPKGSDCYEKFRDMQECMTKYPSLYNKHTMEDDDDAMGIQDALNQSEQSTSANTNVENQSALQDRDKTKSEKST